MSVDPAEVYGEIVLDHVRRPHHQGRLESASGRADGFNPLCGDRVEVFVETADGAVRDIAFEGEGCAISTASASIMTDAVVGRPIAEARGAIARFLDAMTRSDEVTLPSDQHALAHVRRLPMRVKCATLAWRAAEAALDQAEQGAAS